MCLTELILLVPKIEDGKRICRLENGEVIDANQIGTFFPTELIYHGQKTVTINCEKENPNLNTILLGEVKDSKSRLYNAYFCAI